MALYFGPEVDIEIARYNAEIDRCAKNKIFEEGIRPAFLKLIESQLQLYKFYKIDDPEMLKNECLTHLYETLPRFDQSKGKKAFSYFNVVVKHWFIHKTREKRKRQKQEAENFFGLDHEIVKNNPTLVSETYEDALSEKEFWLSLFRDINEWRAMLKKRQEVQVLDAIVFLLQNPHLVTVFNKKAVYLYIREMTGLTMKQVNHNVNKLKILYLDFRGHFNSGGQI